MQGFVAARVCCRRPPLMSAAAPTLGRRLEQAVHPRAASSSRAGTFPAGKSFAGPTCRRLHAGITAPPTFGRPLDQLELRHALLMPPPARAWYALHNGAGKGRRQLARKRLAEPGSGVWQCAEGPEGYRSCLGSRNWEQAERAGQSGARSGKGGVWGRGRCGPPRCIQHGGARAGRRLLHQHHHALWGWASATPGAAARGWPLRRWPPAPARRRPWRLPACSSSPAPLP